MRITLLAGALGLFLAPAAALARPSLDPARLDQLDRYEVLMFGDPVAGGLERSKAIGVFDATPDEVFRIATEYQHYPEFMPRVSSMRLIAP